ncbi:glycerol-3-phosphate dehydrogenase [Mycoplasma testudineum]|uniref:Glycerol-3-phosphate dehydrogenase n=1 Tax=Mycoplasma testudineum TaxID=244584 RepID=A0A4R6IBV0_9MOLU|nr:hypothetical protein [Mycoplasma testudineum]OYD26579.1 hypothetical protein CG473_02995 [Mycoplasma testudineum]TDO19412.1 glycerol-3-phosphate dehydrogenase [Mycoplasma testudineum]
MKNIAIIGFKEKGMSIAKALSLNHNSVQIKAYSSTEKTTVNYKNHKFNPFFNESLEIENLEVSSNIEKTLKDADLILFTVDNSKLEDYFPIIFKYIKKEVTLLFFEKGNFPGTYRNVQNHLLEITKDNPLIKDVMLISGSYNLKSLYQNNLQVVTLSASNKKEALKVRELFKRTNFRIYISLDVIGIEIYSNLAEMAQLIAGMSQGMEFSRVTTAAIIGRTICEAGKITKVLGGQYDSLISSAIFPSVLLHTFDETKINFQIGLDVIRKGKRALGITKHKSPFDALLFFVEQAKIYNIKLPMLNTIYGLLQKEISPKSALDEFIKTDVPFEAIHDFMEEK